MDKSHVQLMRNMIFSMPNSRCQAMAINAAFSMQRDLFWGGQ
jgi:hypothetical protein